MTKRLLFIDRDGTIINEPPITFQVDTLEQLAFLPGVIRNLYRIQNELGYELVMVSNQDGLGTENYPEERFNIVQEKMLEILSGEGIIFKSIHIDRSFEHEQANTRKPGIGMLLEYTNGEYDLINSYVIGDRVTDVKLAMNLGTKAIFIQNNDVPVLYEQQIELITDKWDDIFNYLKDNSRKITWTRKTSETDISVQMNVDGTGKYNINTGLAFFNHMLEQFSKHSCIDLSLQVKGDLHIDEHHTIEDTAIAIGEAISKALGDKRGIERYGFCLPMDDCLAQVAIDFGGRNWIVWNADFKREYIGDVPTEMLYHFFKSFSDAARCNINIQATGTNEHHKIEAVFKAFAKAVKMAVKKDSSNRELPSTKGML